MIGPDSIGHGEGTNFMNILESPSKRSATTFYAVHALLLFRSSDISTRRLSLRIKGRENSYAFIPRHCMTAIVVTLPYYAWYYTMQTRLDEYGAADDFSGIVHTSIIRVFVRNSKIHLSLALFVVFNVKL